MRRWLRLSLLSLALLPATALAVAGSLRVQVESPAYASVGWTECVAVDDPPSLLVAWRSTVAPLEGETETVYLSDLPDCSYELMTLSAPAAPVAEGRYPRPGDAGLTASELFSLMFPSRGYCGGDEGADGVLYVCAVRTLADGSVGAVGVASVLLDSILPPAPESVVATPLDGGAVLSWDWPAGNEPASRFVVRVVDPQGAALTFSALDVVTRSLRVTGLQNEVVYTATVGALDFGGVEGNAGPDSDPVAFVPSASLGFADQLDSSTWGCGQAGLSWLALLPLIVSRRRRRWSA